MMKSSDPVTAADGADIVARILLVEDDVELREGLAEHLRLNGMAVTEAESGAAFRRAAARAAFEVAIVDVNLPDVSGFLLARELADTARRPGIIILTARTGQGDRIQGYAGGADLYMTKPVDGEELALVVRNMARRVRAAAAASAGAAPAGGTAWRLNLPAQQLIAPDGTAIALSGRETLLVQQFVAARGDPVPRMALGAIMGYGPPGPRNRGLDAALRRLRRKGEEGGVAVPFQIVHSIGIRFTEPLHLI